MDTGPDDVRTRRLRTALQGFFARTPRLRWMNDADLPWNRRRTTADVACLCTLLGTTVFALVWGAFQPAILAASPLLGAFLGDRLGFVLTGAGAPRAPRWRLYVLALAVGSVARIKFTWVTWWAGRLWGRAVLDVMVRDKSERIRRRYAHFWDLADRFGSTFLALSVTPFPLPGRPIHAAVGAARMSLTRFLVLVTVTAAVVNATYFGVGWWLGPRAMDFVNAYVRRWLPLATVAMLALLAIVATFVGVCQRRTGPSTD